MVEALLGSEHVIDSDTPTTCPRSFLAAEDATPAQYEIGLPQNAAQLLGTRFALDHL